MMVFFIVLGIFLITCLMVCLVKKRSCKDSVISALIVLSVLSLFLFRDIYFINQFNQGYKSFYNIMQSIFEEEGYTNNFKIGESFCIRGNVIRVLDSGLEVTTTDKKVDVVNFIEYDNGDYNYKITFDGENKVALYEKRFIRNDSSPDIFKVYENLISGAQ